MNEPLARRRAIVFVLTMLAAAVTAQSAKPQRRVERARVAEPLELMFPRRFGTWTIDEAAEVFVRPADEAGKLYGVYDQVLERAYIGDGGQRVMLSVAYGSEQSNALQVHLPEVCYASSGFRVSEVREVTMKLGVKSVVAKRLLAAMPGRSEPVTYWTVLGDEVVSGSTAFRWKRFAKGLGGDILDGMLVRLSSVARDTQAAFDMHERFANELRVAMMPKHETRVFGS